ncbi:MAG: ATP-binding protein [Gallionella sp.]|nr:ATP-binding protein [Gallionella sp.]
MPDLNDNETLASTHFRLVFYAAVVAMMRQAVEAFGDFDSVTERFPFLGGYSNELAREGLLGVEVSTAPSLWREKVETFEGAHDEFLPLRALRECAGLSYADMVLLAGAGLVEDDLRIGTLFEALHGVTGESRPIAGLLASWLQPEEDTAAGLNRIRRLAKLGLLVATNPAAPLSGWGLRLPDGLWSVLRGDGVAVLPDKFLHRPRADVAYLNELVLPAALTERARGLAALLAAGELDLLVLRGPMHNGRGMLAAAIAGEAGYGVLGSTLAATRDADVARSLCPLAAALGAIPMLVGAAHLGERLSLPEGYWTGMPVIVILGHEGGMDVPTGLRMAILELPMPEHVARSVLWARALPDASAALREGIAGEARIATGIIFGIATQARVQAHAAGRASIEMDDLHQAARSYGREALDALTMRLPPLFPIERQADGAVDTSASLLIVEPGTAEELALLEYRCRHRDQFGMSLGPAFGKQISSGVRALFTGASGTGKTLAARILASRLGKDIYVCNLAAIVSKYIGETEKNMGELLDCATATDVVLLIDEADALFGKRIEAVSNSVDHHMNNQTNFLLQRMDSYQGIVILTTNLSSAIDSAFRRRMDATVDFYQPSSLERQRILLAHLPVQHAVTQDLLDEFSLRCVLSGGQIRNIVLHAALLAGDKVIGEHELYRAVQREYRQMGGLCPLPEMESGT